MHSYESDIIAWANEQAAFIRAGRFDCLDIEHLADEIEDVGKSEQRELESRMWRIYLNGNIRLAIEAIAGRVPLKNKDVELLGV